ncbi:putative EthD domain-containing protein [Paraburkholderia sacchari]
MQNLNLEEMVSLKSSVGIVAVLGRKPQIDSELFSSYWRDIHGAFVAAYGGPARYRQLHLAAYDPELWADASVARDLGDVRPLDGIAEFIFSDAEARHQWASTVGSFADADDPNVFARSTSYSIAEGGLASWRDASVEPSPDTVRLIIMLKAAQSPASLHDYLVDELASAVNADDNASDDIAYMQVTRFNPYTIPDWVDDETGVDRVLKPCEQYDVMLEIAFRDDTSRQRFFHQQFPQYRDRFASEVASLNVYRVRNAYTLIHDGKLTLNGWLGHDRAALVQRVGAGNIRLALDKVNAELSGDAAHRAMRAAV